MDFDTERERLVDRLAEQHDLSPAVVAAMRRVPRHRFVPPDRSGEAYRDRPLPIGHGQTISAPHMVALMTDALDADRGAEVLEIGTGCGYHAAVVSEVTDAPVYSVEVVEALAAAARERFDELGYDVRVRVGDGSAGWPDHAPYDAAYLTCAPDAIPDAVVEQVRPGGRVVGPVGARVGQQLVRLTVRADGVEREDLGGVRFVPMR